MPSNIPNKKKSADPYKQKKILNTSKNYLNNKYIDYPVLQFVYIPAHFYARLFSILYFSFKILNK